MTPKHRAVALVAAGTAFLTGASCLFGLLLSGVLAAVAAPLVVLGVAALLTGLLAVDVDQKGDDGG